VNFDYISAAVRRVACSCAVLFFLALPRAWSAPLQQTAPAGEFSTISDSATKARESGQTAKAIELYRQAVSLKPDWAEGWWYLGTLQYDADQYAAAIPAFQSLTRLIPQSPAPWNFLGLSEFETGAYDAAKADLERGHAAASGEDDETRRPATYHLALLKIRAGAFSEGIELMKQDFATGPIPDNAKTAFGLATLRVGLLPSDVDPSKDALIARIGEAAALLAQGKKDAAIRAYSDLESQNTNVPFFHFAYALALEAAEDKAGALAQYSKELKVFPANTEAHLAIDRLNGKPIDVVQDNSPDSRVAKLYARENAALLARDSPANGNDIVFEQFKQEAASNAAAGKWNESIAALKRALEIRPNWDDGLWQLAAICFSQGRMEESLRALKLWTARNPNSGTAWAMTALGEFALHDFDNSLVHFERAESFGFTGSQDSVRTALYRYALLEIHASRFTKALQLLADRRLNSTSDPQLQFAIGLASLRLAKFPEEMPPAQMPLISMTGEAMALLYASRYDDGLPRLKALTEQFPSTPLLHFLYGKALSSLSNYDEAAEQFLLEIGLSPSQPSAFTDLALTRLQQHRPADGLDPAQRAVKLAPDSAEAHYALGRIYLDLKKNDEARSELETAARQAPQSPEIHFNLAKAYARTNQLDRADAERAIFARLNDAAEKQRAGNHNQTYGELRGETGISTNPPSPQ